MSDETPRTDPPEEASGAEAATEAAEAPEEAQPTFSSEVEETGPCARLVRIEIPAETVQEEIDKSYDELRKTVFIKGFRQGHVPRHILERRFSDQVLEAVKRDLVEGKLSEAIEKHELRLVSTPSLDLDEIKLEPGQPLAFEATVEVFPAFTIDNYTGLEVERPDTTVTDEEVQRAVESLRLREARYEKVEEGTIAEGDVPICHAIFLKDGQEVLRREELGANLQAETIGGLKVEGLKSAFVGAGLGETRTFENITLPENFGEEALRGQTVTIQVTVDEIRRFVLPEVTDEWANSLHFEDLDDLREELRDQLRLERQRLADDAVRERIEDKLLELTDFDVPEGLVERLVAQATERQRLALLYQGVPQDRLDEELRKQAPATREQSIRDCKLFFILERIADQEKIFVTESEVEQRIQAIALNYRRRPQDVRAELEEQGRLDSLRRQMREEKVMDFLIQKANITQAPPPPERPESDTPRTSENQDATPQE